MGQTSSNSGVTACCPKCGTLHTATTLSKLAKAVQGCCGGKKVLARTQLSGVKSPISQARPELPLIFSLPRQVQSQNKSTYAHWSKYRKDKQAWLKLTDVVFLPWHHMRLSWSRWRIERIFKSPKRLFDFANLVGGAKPLIDCLIDHDLIYDDDPKHFKCEYEQRPGDDNYTLLTLMEYTDG